MTLHNKKPHSLNGSAENEHNIRFISLIQTFALTHQNEPIKSTFSEASSESKLFELGTAVMTVGTEVITVGTEITAVIFS